MKPLFLNMANEKKIRVDHISILTVRTEDNEKLFKCRGDAYAIATLINNMAISVSEEEYDRIVELINIVEMSSGKPM